jgi:hypothetical protein
MHEVRAAVPLIDGCRVHAFMQWVCGRKGLVASCSQGILLRCAPLWQQ